MNDNNTRPQDSALVSIKKMLFDTSRQLIRRIAWTAVFVVLLIAAIATGELIAGVIVFILLVLSGWKTWNAGFEVLMVREFRKELGASHLVLVDGKPVGHMSGGAEGKFVPIGEWRDREGA